MPYGQHNPSSPARQALGAQLFTDPRLSASGKTSCQSCHVQALGWADGRRASRRDDGTINTRHTPMLYNVGYQRAWSWDGGAPTLETQVLDEWCAQLGADRRRIAAALNRVPGYRQQFLAEWGAEATPELVVEALSVFVRGLRSDGSSWDRHEAGVADAVSAEAIAGEARFAGKAHCTTCHWPPYYGNSTFFDVGLERRKPQPDDGRYQVTRVEADRHAFKIPTLRSVARSAPYFHDGSAATLQQAVRIMAGGGKADPNKTPFLVPVGLSETEIDQIVAFLNSLSSTEDWVQPAQP